MAWRGEQKRSVGRIRTEMEAGDGKTKIAGAEGAYSHTYTYALSESPERVDKRGGSVAFL